MILCSCCTARAQRKKTPSGRKKRKKKRPQPPVSDAPSSIAERSDVDGGDGTSTRETAEAVRPLTMAERRARKAEARAAKIEAARLKKETEARDARMAEVDLEDGAKTFTIKVCRAPIGSLWSLPCIHFLATTMFATKCPLVCPRLKWNQQRLPSRQIQPPRTTGDGPYGNT